MCRDQDTWIIVYSLARLRHRDKELIHHLGAHVVSRNLTEFRPQGIANLAYSIGLLGMKHRSLLRALCAHMTPCRLEEFSEQEVANLTYGLALVRWRDTGVLSSICQHVLANASGFKPRGLSSLFYSLGLLDFREETFFYGVCDQIQFRLPTFNAQDISNTVYGLGLLELSHQGLLSAVEAEMSGRLEEFTGQGLGNVVYGFGLLERECPDLLQAIADHIPTRFDDMTEQNISNIVWAMGNLGFMDGRTGEPVEAERRFLFELHESSFKYSVYTHHTVEGQLLEASRRSGACGLMALTQTKDGLLVFGRRSRYVGAFAGFYHCVPAGMVDEIGADWKSVERCNFMALMDAGHEQGHKYEFVLSMKLSLTAEEVHRRYQNASDKKEHEERPTTLVPPLLKAVASSGIDAAKTSGGIHTARRMHDGAWICFNASENA
eukprot:s1218_g8.t2